MSMHKLLKLNARRALRGRWGPAAAVTLMVLAIGFLFNLFEGVLNVTLGVAPFDDVRMTPNNLFDDLANTSALALSIAFATAALAFVITTPLSLGVQRWFYRLGEGVLDEISTAFEFFGTFRLFWKSLLLCCSVWVRSALWSALFLLPGSLVIFFSAMVGDRSGTNRESFAAAGGILVGCLLLVLGMLFAIIWCSRYYLARYYLMENVRCSVRQAVRSSIASTKEYRCSIFLFELSFFGWYLLCLLVFPYLFVYPYHMTARGLYARYLMTAAEQPPPSGSGFPESAGFPEQAQHESWGE